MSYYQQRGKQRLFIGKDSNSLVTLIAINLVIFVILSFIKLVYWANQGQEAGDIMFQQNILRWLTLPADPGVLLERPWTLLTHFVVHAGVWHVLGNMLWLWAFGFIMRDLTGNRQLVPVFFYGAMAGAAAFMLAYNLLGVLRPDMPNASALGASAGVMAIAVATTMLAPDYRLFPMLNGGIPLWVLTIIFVIIDFATIPNGNPGGHIAHLAGAAMGAVFVLVLRRGYDLGAWINNFFAWVNDLFNPDKQLKRQRVREQLYYRSQVKPFTKTSHLTQQKVDEILDKISQKGYNHLTQEEKELLKRASQEDL